METPYQRITNAFLSKSSNSIPRYDSPASEERVDISQNEGSSGQPINDNPVKEIEEVEVASVPEDAAAAEVDAAIARAATDFKKLMNEPLQGSMLHYVNLHKTGMADVEAYVIEKWLPKIGSVMWDDDVDFWTYFLYSSVLPHGRAVSIAEAVTEKSKASGLTNWQVLSSITGFNITGRQDLGAVMRAMGRRTPKLWSMVMQLSQAGMKKKYKFSK